MKTAIDKQSVIKTADQYLMNTYSRQPIVFVDGFESTLIDSEGKHYTDFLAGIAVTNLGYSNEKVKSAMLQQANTLVHTSNLFHIEPQVALAKLLCDNSFADKAFFSNSGAEANEGAVKLARKRAYLTHGSEKNEIVAMKGSFHGRTLATMNMTDNAHYREGYGPHPSGFVFTPFNDSEALKQVVGQQTAAIILEPIQGEGGVYPATPDFLQTARQLADQYDCALIFDEIQCGMGRSGYLFAYEELAIEPDIITLAKALANGLPIGAILAKGDYATTFQPGSHGTTFGGNPLATAAGKATVEELLKEGFLDTVKEKSHYMKKQLLNLQANQPLIKEVRGKGLLLGLELNSAGATIVQEMLAKGFIINCTQGTTLRFIPPLTISYDEIDAMVAALTDLLGEVEV